MFSLDFGGSIGTRVCSFVTALTNLNLITSEGTTSVGAIMVSGLATGREVKYAVGTELPDGDFTITGDAFFKGPSASPPTPIHQGNWQIKAAYAIPVPGPLPILGTAAAFGWSRQLRRRISPCR